MTKTQAASSAAGATATARIRQFKRQLSMKSLTGVVFVELLEMLSVVARPSLAVCGGFGGFCLAANLDPVAGQFLAMNVTAAIGGLDHVALQTASDDEISAHVNALAQQFDVPPTYIGSVSGGMAEVLFSKDSTSSPHYGTYVAINKAVFNPQNAASAPQSETESTDSTAAVANGAGLIGIAAGVMSLFALFI
ncbi:hypothetical protein HDU98_009788 [Podochytrium sp. JEL0797]|nr:hypothetical protein HDU98_009788 [Podochytrium sp. JEL0797]